MSLLDYTTVYLSTFTLSGFKVACIAVSKEFAHRVYLFSLAFFDIPRYRFLNYQGCEIHFLLWEIYSETTTDHILRYLFSRFFLILIGERPKTFFRKQRFRSLVRLVWNRAPFPQKCCRMRAGMPHRQRRQSLVEVDISPPQDKFGNGVWQVFFEDGLT